MWHKERMINEDEEKLEWKEKMLLRGKR